jgi:hypothetical protein
MLPLAMSAWWAALLVSVELSPTRQGWHDRLARTIVVHPAARGSDTAARGCLIVLGLHVVVMALIMVLGLIMYFLGIDPEVLSSLGRPFNP